MSDFNLPTSIGTYTFIEQIHVPGNVWRAINKKPADQSHESRPSEKQDENPFVSIFIISKRILDSQKQQTIFASEIALMKQMNENPYIAHFYEFCEDESSYYIILDDIPQLNHNDHEPNENPIMSLSEYIKTKGKISSRAAKNFLNDILNFFSYFESNLSLRNAQIELTPDTIFVQEEKHKKKRSSQSKPHKSQVKPQTEANGENVADNEENIRHEDGVDMVQSIPVFHSHSKSHSHLAKISIDQENSESDTEKSKKRRSTRLKIVKVFVFGEDSKIIFSSPEIVTGCSPPESINGNQVITPPFTWICGVLLYYVLTGELPFKGTTKAEVELAILNDHLTFPPGIDQECADLVQKLLVKNQITRPPLTTIPNLMWISQNMNENELATMQEALRNKRKSVPGIVYQNSIPQSKSVEVSLKDIDQMKSANYFDSSENGSTASNESSSSKNSRKIPIGKNNSTLHMPVGNKVRLTPRRNFMGLGKQLSLTLTKPPTPNS